MQWKDEYAIGIPEIDHQHKILLGYLTEFERAFAGQLHWNTVHPLIVRARGFVQFHFAVEEAVMNDADVAGTVVRLPMIHSTRRSAGGTAPVPTPSSCLTARTR